MLNKIKELVTELIEKNVLYSFLITYALAVISCAVVVMLVEDGGGSNIFGNTGDINEETSIEGEVTSNIFVEVAGAIKSPGVFELDEGSRIIDLVNLAGGFNEDASEVWISRYINLSNQLQDAQKIYIPYKWDDLDRSEDTKMSDMLTLIKPYVEDAGNVVIATNNAVQNKIGSGSADISSSFLVNINTASQEDIDGLPGIGPAYATRFIENRSYADVDELKEKSGVSESVIEKIKDLITY